MMECITAGESHGAALTAIVTGVPAGIRLEQEDFDAELRRRACGYGRSARQQIETNHACISSGIRFSKTIGTPLAITIANDDHEAWKSAMSVFGEQPDDYTPVTAPRMGHADLPGCLKIASEDCRDIIERASARETAARVAGGTVAKVLLRSLGVDIYSYVTRIGMVELPQEAKILEFNNQIIAAIEASPVRCPDLQTSSSMCTAIDEARASGDTLGGWFDVIATGLVAGLGEYANPHGRLSSRLGAAFYSIPAIKGVSLGEGFAAGMKTGKQGIDKGGLVGGMTTGEPLVIHACMKPIPTLPQGLPSVDIKNGLPCLAQGERADICAVPAAAVIAETELAFVLANAYIEKFGGDCLDDMQQALAAYRMRIDMHSVTGA